MYAVETIEEMAKDANELSEEVTHSPIQGEDTFLQDQSDLQNLLRRLNL